MVELAAAGSFEASQTFQKGFGGDVLNFAVAASRLGTHVGLFTRLGKDPFGLQLRDVLIEEGIDTRFVKQVAGVTGMYMVSVDETAQREFIYYRKGSAASTLSEADIHPFHLQDVKLVYASGISLAISKTAQQAVFKAFELAKQQGIPTAFDLNVRPSLWESDDEAFDAIHKLLPLVDILFPSVPGDTLPLIGLERPDQVIDYFWHQGVKLIVVKAGSDGCYLGYKGQVERLPALPVEAVDTTGAGDVFNAGFLHGFVQQKPLLECAKLGNTAAGLKVSHPGTLVAIPQKEAVYTQAFGAPSVVS